VHSSGVAGKLQRLWAAGKRALERLRDRVALACQPETSIQYGHRRIALSLGHAAGIQSAPGGSAGESSWNPSRTIVSRQLLLSPDQVAGVPALKVFRDVLGASLKALVLN
jgi:hypothetical protein